MDSKQLYKILSNTYETAMTEERGWEVYSNFINLFKLGEVDTTEYLLDLITLNKNERLLYRHSLAEQGFELTPNEVNQYCLLLVVAMRFAYIFFGSLEYILHSVLRCPASQDTMPFKI